MQTLTLLELLYKHASLINIFNSGVHAGIFELIKMEITAHQTPQKEYIWKYREILVHAGHHSSWAEMFSFIR